MERSEMRDRRPRISLALHPGYNGRCTNPAGVFFMKAAVVGEHGVEIRDVEKPAPKPNEVLIRVRASSLNRADLLVAQDHQHGAVGGVGARLGLECAGEVEAIGRDVREIKAGAPGRASAPRGRGAYTP